MKRAVTARRFILVFWTVLLVALQGAATAHGPANGGDPHERDCVICEMALASENADVALPPPASSRMPAPFGAPRPETAPALTMPSQVSARGPPARGPPSHL